MRELWFWLVSVISVSPSGIRESSRFDGAFNTMEVCHA